MINKKVMYNFFINLNNLLKISFFIKNHNKHDIQSQITIFFARSLRLRTLGVNLAFININIDFGISKTRTSNKQTHHI